MYDNTLIKHASHYGQALSGEVCHACVVTRGVGRKRQIRGYKLCSLFLKTAGIGCRCVLLHSSLFLSYLGAWVNNMWTSKLCGLFHLALKGPNQHPNQCLKFFLCTVLLWSLVCLWDIPGNKAKEEKNTHQLDPQFLFLATSFIMW